MPLIVQLRGGPRDGDLLSIAPQSSVGPPQAFGYWGRCGGAVGFHVYSSLRITTWPPDDTLVVVHSDYAGFGQVPTATVPARPPAPATRRPGGWRRFVTWIRKGVQRCPKR
jgi:hypothetical protein